mgnify:FL=1
MLGELHGHILNIETTHVCELVSVSVMCTSYTLYSLDDT